MESGYGFNSKRIVKEYRDSNPLVTGLWKKLDDAASYSSPLLYSHAGSSRLAFLTAKGLVSFDPQDGAIHWKYPFVDLLLEDMYNSRNQPAGRTPWWNEMFKLLKIFPYTILRVP